MEKELENKMNEKIKEIYNICVESKCRCGSCPFYIYQTDKNTCIIMSAIFCIKGVKVVNE